MSDVTNDEATAASLGEDTAPGHTMIELQELTKRFPGQETPAVDRLDLKIPKGEIVVFVGPSGCGKTTSLKMINRIIEPTSGNIIMDGEDVTTINPNLLRRRIGYVIQQIGLFPHIRIGENVATVPNLLGWDKDRTSARVDELLEVVGLPPDQYRERFPKELSGGQRQRVGVARALAADPPVLLMDEPFGAVDPIVRGRLQEELLALQERVNKTIVLVTHDLDEAIRLSDRVALLNVGGILEQYASPDELLREPANDFVAEFIGEGRSMRRLSLTTVADVDLDAGSTVAPDASAAEALAQMDRFRTDWVGLVEDEVFIGWIARAAIDAAGPQADLRTLERFQPAATTSLRQTLHTALETIMNSTTLVAVVEDEGRFCGTITMERIHRELAEGSRLAAA